MIFHYESNYKFTFNEIYFHNYFIFDSLMAIGFPFNWKRKTDRFILHIFMPWSVALFRSSFYNIPDSILLLVAYKRRKDSSLLFYFAFIVSIIFLWLCCLCNGNGQSFFRYINKRPAYVLGYLGLFFILFNYRLSGCNAQKINLFLSGALA